MTEKAKEARAAYMREYMREYRRNHPEYSKRKNEKYWEAKAKQKDKMGGLENGKKDSL